jgi:ethylbenzene dioxygenase beta subunit
MKVMGKKTRQTPPPSTPVRRAAFQIAFDISQFLHAEARLLDDQRFDAWLAVFAADLRYWVPGIQSRYRADGGVTHDSKAMAFFDDTLDELRQRVTKFEQTTAWGENPPTRVAHVVSNVEVELTALQGEFLVHSIVTLHRCRNEAEIYQTVARRRDVVRDTPEGYRIAKRDVFLLETVLLAKNLDTFF